MGLPYLAIIIGSLSEEFVKATMVKNFYFIPGAYALLFARRLISALVDAQIWLSHFAQYHHIPRLVNTSDHGWRFFGDVYTLEDFRDAAMHRVYQSLLIGVVLMFSATIQVCYILLRLVYQDRTFRLHAFFMSARI